MTSPNHIDQDLTPFERKVLVEALEEFVEHNSDRHSGISAVSELHARSVATARDLAMRLA